MISAFLLAVFPCSGEKFRTPPQKKDKTSSNWIEHAVQISPGPAMGQGHVPERGLGPWLSDLVPACALSAQGSEYHARRAIAQLIPACALSVLASEY
eukprot:1809390-Rhodomonas_salina.2